MRGDFFGGLVGALLFFATVEDSHAQVLDRIVAVVNDEVVTEAELEFEMGRVETSIASSATAAVPAREELRSRILELLINKRLQLQRSEALGIGMDDDALKRNIDAFRENNGLARASEFEAYLGTLGLTPADFGDVFREDMIIQEAVRRDVFPFMNISEEELDRQIRKQRGDHFVKDYRLSHILLEVGAGASDEDWAERKRFAEEVRNSALAGESFESLAVLHSDAENSLNGGNLGWRDSSLLPDEFLNALLGMQEGEVSSVIKVGNGFHLLYLTEVREVPLVAGEAAVRLGIITLDGEGEGAEAFADEIYDRIRKGESFEDLARQHSIDPGSADKGGDVGWLDLDEILPPIAETVAGMEKGEISRPIRSPLGFHVVNLVDRSAKLFDEKRLRNEAIEDLQERHLFEARRDWINLLRSNAHIEIKETG